MLVPIVPIYTHSPDRMPTPTPSRDTSLTAATAAAAPGSESPKRRYAEAMTVQERVPALSVNVASMVNEDRVPESNCNSPRSRVAERLEALDIDQSEDAPRKRARFTDATHDEKAVGLGLTPVQSHQLAFDYQSSASRPVLEIKETPDCRPDSARSPTPSPLAKRNKPSAPPVIEARPKISPKRMRSPPPPTTHSAASDPLSGSSQDSEKDAKRAGAMTWQDSEITGHEIDASIDDDGEGINGIGFRPTPAIAQARTQKRKQQVHAWRAREAREARQRRFEKRQGCSVDASAGDESQRRVVRFEGVG